MEGRRSGELSGHLRTLFQAGAIGGLPDAELLERFVTGRDDSGEAAFRALVERHGPMVSRVCRGVLHDPHAAEDAVQVTFLALARKAGSIREHASLASWLHGTARHVALKARTAARRRLARESRAAEADVPRESPDSFEGHEVSPILHEEIDRLPEKYRAPIVLCYLEGMTHDRAAVELGWPVGTVRGRLARARDLLRSRLTRRGLASLAGLVGAESSAEAASVGLSAAMVEATVRAAIGRSASRGLSGTAAPLLRAILRERAVARFLRLVAPLALIAGLAGGAAIFLDRAGGDDPGRRAPVAGVVPTTRPAPTDAAGDPLPDGALARLGTARFAPGAAIHQIAYSPDGRLLASIDADGELELWDADTGERRLSIVAGEQDGMRVDGMAFAPDGRTIALRSPSTTILHEIPSGRLVRRFEEESRRHGHSAQPRALAFSPDGSMLAASFHDAPLVLWDVGTGRRIRSFGDDSQGLANLAFSPDGAVLIASRSATVEPTVPGRKPAGPEQSLILAWDVATGREVRRIPLGKTAIGEVTAARDGKTAAVAMDGEVPMGRDGRLVDGATADGSILLLDLATGREVRRIGGTGMRLCRPAFSPDGTLLAAGEDSSGPGVAIDDIPRATALHLWDVASGRELHRWEVRAAGTACLAFAPGVLPSGSVFRASTSAPRDVTITPRTHDAPTALTLQGPMAGIEKGADVPVVVTVQGPDGLPPGALAGGSVTLTTIAPHPVVLGRIPVGVFDQPMTFLADRLKRVGTYRVQAVYRPGSNRFAGSTAAPATIAVTPMTATSFRVTPVVRHGRLDQPLSFAVTALDARGRPLTDYTGTVTFTSPTASATVLPTDVAQHLGLNTPPDLASFAPASYTFTRADRGAHKFVDAVRFDKGGAETLQVTQADDPEVYGETTFAIA